MIFSSRLVGRAVRPIARRHPAASPQTALRTRFESRSYAIGIEKRDSELIIQNGESEAKIPSLWLRDNCRCAQCVNQDTMQRNFDTFQIPTSVAPESIVHSENGIRITWTDSHKSQYSSSWLEQTLQGLENKAIGNNNPNKLWNASIATSPPEVTFEAVMNKEDPSGMAKLTDKLRSFGVCFVDGTPHTPEATEKLLESIGPIRNTHYGGFYDFIPDLSLADTAYTNLALAAHTDTTYFTEPAGLQAFHMLSHTPPPNQPPGEALGGQSLLVDGFNAAQELRKEDPSAYDILRRVKIPWHASGNQGVAIAPDRAYPVIEASDNHLHRVRWNNDDRGVVPFDAGVEEWYNAARKWHEILTRKTNEYWFQLQPGRVLIFDNWRVLHGRSAFEGLRRICGGYINRDDFISRWKMTNFPRQEVITDNMQLRSPLDAENSRKD